MEPTRDQSEDSSTSDDARIGREMLARIGWHDSDLKQIELFSQMPPAKKVALMFRLRNQQVKLLEARLRREHPDKTDIDIFWLVQEHLDLVREDKSGW